MTQPTSLDLLQEITAELVAQELRSESVVIARLCTLIIEAVRVGHSHRSIHEAITAGGLATSWTNYRIALGRARKAQRQEGSANSVAPPPLSAAVAAAAPAASSRGVEMTSFMPRESGEMRDSGGTSSATHVMDALRQARKVASKDYGRIARDHYRQQQRNRPPKDRS